MATVEEAIAAIKSGDKAKGREIIAELLKADRNNEMAWLWLTQTDITLEQKLKSLQNVLKINPDNETAKEGLRKLQRQQPKSELPSEEQAQAQQRQRSQLAKKNRHPLVLILAGIITLACIGSCTIFGLMSMFSSTNTDNNQLAAPNDTPISTAVTTSSSNTTTEKTTQEQALEERLSYLQEIPEVSWVEIEGNNVYIGFNSIPDDFGMIVRAAAFHGNNTINFGVHAWAVDAKYTGWRPGQGKPYICEATARSGKVQDSNCN